MIALAIAFLKGGWQLTSQGLVQAGRLVETVWFRLILGFTLGGLIQVLIPRDIIARWIGPASGTRGVLIGSYVAIILSGPPYVMIPVAASLYMAGAGAGPIIALLTGQSLLGLQNLITWQIPFLGVGIPISKYIIALIVTPLAGFGGAAIFKLLTKVPDTATMSVSPPSPAVQYDGDGKTIRSTEKGRKT
ncbi:MAG: permease [Chloroflexi bacterium]|nr:permease [Chloroflexota bacterium]